MKTPFSRTFGSALIGVVLFGGTACAQQQDAQDPWGQNGSSNTNSPTVSSVYVPVNSTAPGTQAPIYQITPQQREQLKVTMAQTAQQVGQAAKDFKEFYAEMQKAFQDSGIAEEIDKLNLQNGAAAKVLSVEDSAGFGATDVKVEPTNMIVTIDLPGVEKKNVSVALAEASQLKIRVDRGEPKEADRLSLAERFRGKYEKTIQLPYKAKNTSFKAELKNGVLTVAIPKDKTAVPNEVSIPIS